MGPTSHRKTARCKTWTILSKGYCRESSGHCRRQSPVGLATGQCLRRRTNDGHATIFISREAVGGTTGEKRPRRNRRRNERNPMTPEIEKRLHSFATYYGVFDLQTSEGIEALLEECRKLREVLDKVTAGYFGTKLGETESFRDELAARPTSAEFERVCTSNRALEKEVAQLRHERDAWKACARHLAADIVKYAPHIAKSECWSYALAEFQRLKGSDENRISNA